MLGEHGGLTVLVMLKHFGFEWVVTCCLKQGRVMIQQDFRRTTWAAAGRIG